MPLYLVLLVVVYCICSIGIGKGTGWWFNEQIPYWVYFTFTQNIYMGVQNTLGNLWLIPTWTLGVEEQFYILLSLLIYFTNQKWLLFLVIIGIICSPIFRYFSPSMYGLTTFPYCRFDSLFTGILIAIIYQKKEAVKFFNINKKTIITVAEILLLITVVFSVGYIRLPMFIVNSWFAMVYAIILLLVLIDTDGYFSKISQNKFLNKVGCYSYSIYLFHQVVLGLLFFCILNKQPELRNLQDLVLIALAIVLVFFISRFTYQYVEKPFIKKGHQYRY